MIGEDKLKKIMEEAIDKYAVDTTLKDLGVDEQGDFAVKIQTSEYVEESEVVEAEDGYWVPAMVWVNKGDVDSE